MEADPNVLDAARALRRRSVAVLNETAAAKEWASLDRDTAICGLLVADAILWEKAPKCCFSCGDNMKHDDDGPLFCRFCNMYGPICDQQSGGAIGN